MVINRGDGRRYQQSPMKDIRGIQTLVCGPVIRRYVGHANFPVTGSFSILLSWFQRIKRFPLPKKAEKEARRLLFFVFLSFSEGAVPPPNEQAISEKHHRGFGVRPRSGGRWRWKQRRRLRDQHRLGKVSSLFFPLF